MANKHTDVNALRTAVETAHARMTKVQGGKNADYIPYLASVPSDLAGVALMTREGEMEELGDCDHAFAIESISKVPTLALVMEAIGPEGVRTQIGVDPTGLPFNSILALEIHHGKPLSPLVNAGAIATASLVPGANAEERWKNILDMQSRLAGRQIEMSKKVNQSEQTTNFHNRAIAWMLYAAGSCYSDPMEALDIYTRQCSTLITATDLAVMGATLANGGVNPKTGERVISTANVPYILAEMMMEGLYTGSGSFAYEVGSPGKSGVGGGVLSVTPQRLAIAAFSPPLDDDGNSVRGLAALRSISGDLRLNLLGHEDTRS